MNTTTRDYRVEGVHVQCTEPASSADRPPLILVHGGLHGSWNWHRYAPVLGGQGWACHALDWFGHHQSDGLGEAVFVRRSIADVTEEISLVADQLSQTPVLVGHSMGGLACLKYAEIHPTAALILLAPVLPAVIGNTVPGMEIDPAKPWWPPPFEACRDLFFAGVPEDDARCYYGLLCAESPRCVAEATGQDAVDVNLEAIQCPTLALAGEHDRLTPAPRVQRLAERLAADYHCYEGRSHSLLIDSEAEATAGAIADWLAGQVLN